MSFIIRAATPSDLPQLLAIEKESFASPHWQPDDFFKHSCSIAEIDGTIVGFLVCREIFPGEHEILNVAVTPAFRRCGVATGLMQEKLTRSGEFFLEVRESNFGAQKLYRKLGFVEIGRRANYYHSPEETAIVMKMK